MQGMSLAMLGAGLVAGGLASPAHATTEYLGERADRLPISLVTNSRQWSVYQVTPTSSATITLAQSEMDTPDALGYQVVIYGDAGGRVGGLVGTLTQSSTGSTTVSYRGAVTLSQGCTYWVGIKGSTPVYVANPFLSSGSQISPWRWTTTGLRRAFTEDFGDTYDYLADPLSPVLSLSGIPSDARACGGSQAIGATLPPVEHALGFNANGGSCSLSNSGLVVDGTWIRVPSAEQCVRPGFTLLGWNPKPDGSDPLGFDPGGWTLMTDDNTLFAIWVPSG